MEKKVYVPREIAHYLTNHTARTLCGLSINKPDKVLNARESMYHKSCATCYKIWRRAKGPDRNNKA